MTYLDKNILASHSSFERLCVIRSLVVVKEILSDSCSLRLPVRPYSHDTIVNPVAPHGNVDGGMHLDAGDFCPAQFHHIVDVVDVIVFYYGEHSSHAPDDSALLAVVDVVAPYDVASDFFLEPSVVLSLANGVTLHLCGALHVLVCKIVVVVRIAVFSHADSGTLAVADFTVFYYPTL